jgi:hypothetical protein
MFAFDGENHLFKMPLVTKGAGSNSDPFDGMLTKFQCPLARRFISDFNTAAPTSLRPCAGSAGSGSLRRESVSAL